MAKPNKRKAKKKKFGKFTRFKFLKKKGLRKFAPPRIRKWLQNKGHMKITDIAVGRAPVQSYISNTLNFLTAGRFKKSLQELDYEDVFHLFLYITLDNGFTYKIEKNEVVSLKKIKKYKVREGDLSIDMSEVNGELTLSEFMKNGEEFQGIDFWNYSPKNNNCQRFVFSLLSGNGMMTEDRKDYIVQDAKAIFRNNPKFITKLSQGLTDVAGFFDVVFKGV